MPKSTIEKNDVCYCVGCGEDITFDLELINQFGCVVHGVDPTPGSIEYVNREVEGNPKYIFHEYAVWVKKGEMRFYLPRNENHVSHSLSDARQSEKYITVNTLRLSDLFKTNSHEKVKLLKLDIEGAESKVLHTLFEDHLSIEILCVEFDGLVSENKYDQLEVVKIVERIVQDYDLLWAEGLNFTFVSK